MAVSESDRRELNGSLERVIGKRSAETMMSLLPPVGWAEVATKHDLKELEARLDAKLEGFDAKLEGFDAKLGAFDSKLGSMESRINERIIRTALVVNIPTILASFALAFTAVRLG